MTTSKETTASILARMDQEMIQIKRALARIDKAQGRVGSQDTILARIDQRLKHIEDRLERFNDHERRIRSLEAYKAWLVGGIAALGAAITYAIVWVKGEK